MSRFAFTTSERSPGQPMPWVEIALGYDDRWVSILGLIDSGSPITVLPWTYGLDLGMRWEDQRIALNLGGAYRNVEARAAFVMASHSSVTGSRPIRLAVAWARSNDLPVIFGQTNFLMELNVCFYRSQGYFDLWRA